MKNHILPVLILLLSFNLSSQTLNITSHTLKDTSSLKKYDVTAYYPQVDFGPDALMGVRGVAGDINTEILRIINGQAVPFKQQSAEDGLECPQTLNTLEINYTTIYKQNGYICVLFETFSDPRCAAHPMTFRTSFNYSYTAKGLLAIDSLFTPGSGWLEYISKYCINDLREQAKNDLLENIDDMITNGAAPLPDNFYCFTVNNDYLDIIFNLYRVGPYVWGFRNVSIPWKNLSKMIDPQGPVGFLLG